MIIDELLIRSAERRQSESAPSPCPSGWFVCSEDTFDAWCCRAYISFPCIHLPTYLNFSGSEWLRMRWAPLHTTPRRGSKDWCCHRNNCWMRGVAPLYGLSEGGSGQKNSRCYLSGRHVADESGPQINNEMRGNVPSWSFSEFSEDGFKSGHFWIDL